LEVRSTDAVKPDGSGLVILVPMLGRPHRVLPLLESIEQATPAASVLFLLSENDTTVRRVVAETGRPFRVMPYRSVGDYAMKINTGVAVTSEPLLFTGADDLRFWPGWFEAALSALGPGVGVVGTNDLGNPRVIAGEHSTHFLITREYSRLGTIDRPRSGMLMHPEYPHEFVDDELVGTAKLRGAWAMALDAKVEHLHPHWGKAPTDPLYQQQPRRMRLGQAIYRRRRRLWS
jgi:hypothetical protein